MIAFYKTKLTQQEIIFQLSFNHALGTDVWHANMWHANCFWHTLLVSAGILRLSFHAFRLHLLLLKHIKTAKNIFLNCCITGQGNTLEVLSACHIYANLTDSLSIPGFFSRWTNLCSHYMLNYYNSWYCVCMEFLYFPSLYMHLPMLVVYLVIL